MRRIIAFLAAAALALGLAGCYDDVKVVQGTLVSVDKDKKVLVVKDERSPNAALEFQGTAAGAKPGEVVRVAFREREGQRFLMRLQNITKDSKKK